MGETGILGLSIAMTTVAFITNSVVVLPIIAGILVVETGSVILQLLSKKFRGKKYGFPPLFISTLKPVAGKATRLRCVFG